MERLVSPNEKDKEQDQKSLANLKKSTSRENGYEDPDFKWFSLENFLILSGKEQQNEPC